jgi:uncharacterized protein (DUF736 family)
MEYNNNNTAIIFKNNKKENEKHPDYRGTINVDGRELEISLWIKDGKAGKFFSGKIKEPYQKNLDNLEDMKNKLKEMENTSNKIKNESSGLPF